MSVLYVGVGNVDFLEAINCGGMYGSMYACCKDDGWEYFPS